jgi:tetratricopeptide (TPR) repeat protein
MTALLAITIGAALYQGQAADPPELQGQSPQVEASSPTGDTQPARRAVLKQALADFDAAVSIKDHASPKAQRLYARALAGFESLLEGGIVNGGLYYNVANTYLRLGEVGQAIVNYRRALQLLPGDERISKNLQSARNLCRGRIPLPASSAFLKTLFFWHFGTSLADRAMAALVAYVVFWLLILLRLFVFRDQPVVSWTIRGLAALALVVASSVAWETVTRDYRIEGVIISEDVVLRKGNGEYYEPQFERSLAPGVEFRLLETRQDVEDVPWYHAELRDGKKGWLRADQAEVI